MSTPNMPEFWLRNDIQFPRLIAELEMAGAFTPEVLVALEDSTDLFEDEILELVSRACDEWDRIKAAT